MKLSLAICLSVAAVLSAGWTSVAQGPGVGMGAGMGGPGFGMHRPPIERALGLHGGRWWNNPTMIDQLKLTEDQRKAMDQILLDHQKDLIDRRATVEKAELDLEPLMQDDQPNEAKVLAQIDKVAQARADLEKANARFLLAIRAKLSADQWKQLKTLRADRMRHPGRMGSRRMPGPDQPPPPPPGPQSMVNELPGPDIPDTGTR